VVPPQIQYNVAIAKPCREVFLSCYYFCHNINNTTYHLPTTRLLMAILYRHLLVLEYFKKNQKMLWEEIWEMKFTIEKYMIATVHNVAT